MKAKRSVAFIFVALACLLAFVSCKKFLFFDRTIPKEENPRLNKRMPRTNADKYKPPIVTEEVPNPDAGGAFDDWATCYIMVKEGHQHKGGKMHGNFVYPNAPWKQEEFIEVFNRMSGIEMKIDRSSTATALETNSGKEGPNYIRIIGGDTKLWGFCLYFFDRKGNLLNNKILDHSDEYQIFFSISDVDDKGNPYKVLDVRYRGGGVDEKPIEAKYFEGKDDFESRRKATGMFCLYTYRDTWQHEDMGDGVRNFFNIRLLPPFSRFEYEGAHAGYVDCVGLKGHFAFDNEYSDNDRKGEKIDYKQWPVVRMDGNKEKTRPTGLLPHFYIAVRVMKCKKGKKVVEHKDWKPDLGREITYKGCSNFNNPREECEWRELFRVNIPFRVYTNCNDSDPTKPDPNEPYYFMLGREIGLKPEEAFDAANNLVTHGDEGSGGLGLGAWFL